MTPAALRDPPKPKMTGARACGAPPLRSSRFSAVPAKKPMARLAGGGAAGGGRARAGRGAGGAPAGGAGEGRAGGGGGTKRRRGTVLRRAGRGGGGGRRLSVLVP